MPRNEEEVMRNILILSEQLKLVRDLPQIIVSFDEQTDKYVSFTVILLRILKSNPPNKTTVYKEENTAHLYFRKSKSSRDVTKKIP